MKIFVTNCLNLQEKMDSQLIDALKNITSDAYLKQLSATLSTLNELYSLIIDSYEPFIELSKFDREYFQTSLDYTVRQYNLEKDEEKKKRLAERISRYRSTLNDVEKKLNMYMSEKWTIMGLQWLIEKGLSEVENRKPKVDLYINLSNFTTENFSNTLVDGKDISIDGLDVMRDGLIRKGIAKTIELEREENHELSEVIARGLLSEHEFYKYLEQVTDFREGSVWVAIHPFPESVMRHAIRHIAAKSAGSLIDDALSSDIKDEGLLSDLKLYKEEIADAILSIQIDMLSSLFELYILEGSLERAIAFGDKVSELIKNVGKNHNASSLEQEVRILYPLAKIEALRRELKEKVTSNIEEAEALVERMLKELSNIDRKTLSHDILTTYFSVKNLLDHLKFVLEEKPEETIEVMKDFEEEQLLKAQSLVNEAERILSEKGLAGIVKHKESFIQFDTYMKKLFASLIWLSKDKNPGLILRIKALQSVKQWAIGVGLLESSPLDNYFVEGLRARVKHYIWLRRAAELYEKIGNKDLADECKEISKLALKDAYSKEATQLFKLSKMWSYRAYRKRRKHIYDPINGERDISLMSDAEGLSNYEKYHDNAIDVFKTLSEIFENAKSVADDKKEDALLNAISLLHKADALRLEAAKYDGLAERAAFLKDWNDAEGFYDKSAELFNQAAATYAGVVKSVQEGQLGQFAAQMADLCKRLAVFNWDQRKNVSDRITPTFKDESLLSQIYKFA